MLRAVFILLDKKIACNVKTIGHIFYSVLRVSVGPLSLVKVATYDLDF